MEAPTRAFNYANGKQNWSSAHSQLWTAFRSQHGDFDTEVHLDEHPKSLGSSNDARHEVKQRPLCVTVESTPRLIGLHEGAQSQHLAPSLPTDRPSQVAPSVSPTLVSIPPELPVHHGPSNADSRTTYQCSLDRLATSMRLAAHASLVSTEGGVPVLPAEVCEQATICLVNPLTSETTVGFIRAAMDFRACAEKYRAERDAMSQELAATRVQQLGAFRSGESSEAIDLGQRSIGCFAGTRLEQSCTIGGVVAHLEQAVEGASCSDTLSDDAQSISHRLANVLACISDIFVGLQHSLTNMKIMYRDTLTASSADVRRCNEPSATLPLSRDDRSFPLKRHGGGAVPAGQLSPGADRISSAESDDKACYASTAEGGSAVPLSLAKVAKDLSTVVGVMYGRWERGQQLDSQSAPEKPLAIAPTGGSVATEESLCALWSVLEEVADTVAGAYGRDRCATSVESTMAPIDPIESGQTEARRRGLLTTLPTSALRIVQELEAERRRGAEHEVLLAEYEKRIFRWFAYFGVYPPLVPTVEAERKGLLNSTESRCTQGVVLRPDQDIGAAKEPKSSNWILDTMYQLDEVLADITPLDERAHAGGVRGSGALSPPDFTGLETEEAIARDVQWYVRRVVSRAVSALQHAYVVGNASKPEVAPLDGASWAVAPSEQHDHRAAAPTAVDREAGLLTLPACSSTTPATTAVDQQQTKAVGDAVSRPLSDESNNASEIDRALHRLAQLIPTGSPAAPYTEEPQVQIEPPVHSLDAMIDILISRQESWRQQLQKQAIQSATYRLDKSRMDQWIRKKLGKLVHVLREANRLSTSLRAHVRLVAPGDPEAEEDETCEVRADVLQLLKKESLFCDSTSTDSDTAAAAENEGTRERSSQNATPKQSPEPRHRFHAGASAADSAHGYCSAGDEPDATGSFIACVSPAIESMFKDVEERIRMLIAQHHKAVKQSQWIVTRLQNQKHTVDVQQKRWVKATRLVVMLCQALHLREDEEHLHEALRGAKSRSCVGTAIAATTSLDPTMDLSTPQFSLGKGGQAQRQRSGRRRSMLRASGGTERGGVSPVLDAAVLESLRRCVDWLSRRNLTGMTVALPSNPLEGSVTIRDVDEASPPHSPESNVAPAQISGEARAASQLDREMFQAALGIILDRLADAGKLMKSSLYTLGTDESAEDELVERVMKRRAGGEAVDGSARNAMETVAERERIHAENEDILAVLLQKFGRWAVRLRDTVEDHLHTQRQLLQYIATMYHYVGTAAEVADGDRANVSAASEPPFPVSALLARVAAVDNLIDVDGIMTRLMDGILPALGKAAAAAAPDSQGDRRHTLRDVLNAAVKQGEVPLHCDHRLVRLYEAVSKLRTMVVALTRVRYLSVPTNAVPLLRSGRRSRGDLVFLGDSDDLDGFVELEVDRASCRVYQRGERPRKGRAVPSRRNRGGTSAAGSGDDEDGGTHATPSPNAAKAPRTLRESIESDDELREMPADSAGASLVAAVLDVARAQRDRSVGGEHGVGSERVDTAAGKIVEATENVLDSEALYRVVEMNLSSTLTALGRFSSNYKLAAILVQRDTDGIQQCIANMLAKYSELDIEKTFAQDRSELLDMYLTISERATSQKGCYFFNRPDGTGSCVWATALERLAVGFDALVDKLVHRTQLAKEYRGVLCDAVNVAVEFVNWRLSRAICGGADDQGGEGLAGSRAAIPDEVMRCCATSLEEPERGSKPPLASSAPPSPEDSAVEDEEGEAAILPDSAAWEAASSVAPPLAAPIQRLRDEQALLPVLTYIVAQAKLAGERSALAEQLHEAESQCQVLHEQLALAEGRATRALETVVEVELQRDLALSDAAIARAELRRWRRSSGEVDAIAVAPAIQVVHAASPTTEISTEGRAPRRPYHQKDAAPPEALPRTSPHRQAASLSTDHPRAPSLRDEEGLAAVPRDPALTELRNMMNQLAAHVMGPEEWRRFQGASTQTPSMASSGSAPAVMPPSPGTSLKAPLSPTASGRSSSRSVSRRVPSAASPLVPPPATGAARPPQPSSSLRRGSVSKTPHRDCSARRTGLEECAAPCASRQSDTPPTTPPLAVYIAPGSFYSESCVAGSSLAQPQSVSPTRRQYSPKRYDEPMYNKCVVFERRHSEGASDRGSRTSRTEWLRQARSTQPTSPRPRLATSSLPPASALQTVPAIAEGSYGLPRHSTPQRHAHFDVPADHGVSSAAARNHSPAVNSVFQHRYGQPRDVRSSSETGRSTPRMGTADTKLGFTHRVTRSPSSLLRRGSTLQPHATTHRMLQPRSSITPERGTDFTTSPPTYQSGKVGVYASGVACCDEVPPLRAAAHDSREGRPVAYSSRLRGDLVGALHTLHSHGRSNSRSSLGRRDPNATETQRPQNPNVMSEGMRRLTRVVRHSQSVSGGAE